MGFDFTKVENTKTGIVQKAKDCSVEGLLKGEHFLEIPDAIHNHFACIKNEADLKKLILDTADKYDGNVFLRHFTLGADIEISEEAFKENKTIKKLELPSSITKIGNSAFTNGCLESVVIPESVEEIGNLAFASNKNLETISIPPKTKKGIGIILGTKAHTETDAKHCLRELKKINNELYQVIEKAKEKNLKKLQNRVQKHQPILYSIDLSLLFPTEEEKVVKKQVKSMMPKAQPSLYSSWELLTYRAIELFTTAYHEISKNGFGVSSYMTQERLDPQLISFISDWEILFDGPSCRMIKTELLTRSDGDFGEALRNSYEDFIKNNKELEQHYNKIIETQSGPLDDIESYKKLHNIFLVKIGIESATATDAGRKAISNLLFNYTREIHEKYDLSDQTFVERIFAIRKYYKQFDYLFSAIYLINKIKEATEPKDEQKKKREEHIKDVAQAWLIKFKNEEIVRGCYQEVYNTIVEEILENISFVEKTSSTPTYFDTRLFGNLIGIFRNITPKGCKTLYNTKSVIDVRSTQQLTKQRLLSYEDTDEIFLVAKANSFNKVHINHKYINEWYKITFMNQKNKYRGHCGFTISSLNIQVEFKNLETSSQLTREMWEKISFNYIKQTKEYTAIIKAINNQKNFVTNYRAKKQKQILMKNTNSKK